MPCHPSHKKPTQDTRKVQRQHRWKWGHDPQDPDADPDSGWTYIKLEQKEPTVPNQRHLLKGGPESGMPCQKCGEMTRIAGEMTAEDIINQPEVEVVNRHTLTEKDMKRLRETVILALACPKCETVIQMQKEFVPRVMGKV